ncbi:unnamed protein product [Fraxinus pennsylvanica]|uniref:Uncharacterized protein n=1 Tax=Fraxinus pennsylvanica TaxID=56036 RepID=A0AAD2E245_9LAMI|nr:unnamed protein product [Fraxinus pennsylvanica]
MNQVFPLMFALSVIFLGLYPGTQSQWVPKPPTFPPLCAAQIGTVNRACYMLPFTSIHPPSHPSPTPSHPLLTHSPPSSDNPSGSGHGHRHGHGRRHRETHIEHECCRWLKAVDTVCVCGLLMHLPPFLSRPQHNYTVVVEDSCNVTFQCGSSWMKV